MSSFPLSTLHSSGILYNNIRVLDGEPSCDDVNSYTSLPVVGDASGSGQARCEGCDDIADILTWDVTELEMNAANNWGHSSIYGTYQTSYSPIQLTGPQSNNI